MLTCYKSRVPVKLPHLQRAPDLSLDLQFKLGLVRCNSSSSEGVESPALAMSGVQACLHYEPKIFGVTCSLCDVKHNQMYEHTGRWRLTSTLPV